MPRPRKHNRHLPPRMYLRRGCYYFAHPDTAVGWVNLGRDEAAAYRKYGDHMSAHLDGSTMGAVFARYRLEVIPTKAPKTQAGNLHQIKLLERRYGHMKPSALKAVHGYQLLDAGKAKPHQTIAEFGLLSHVLTKCVEWGYLERNPFIGAVRKKRPPKRRRYVTRDEVDALRALAPPVYQVAIDLAVLTGRRQAEILALTLSDDRPDGLHARAVKGGPALIIGWTEALRTVVDRAKELRRGRATTMLLTTRDARGYTSSGFQSGWQRLMRKAMAAGVLTQSFTFHDLRAVAADRSRDPTKLLAHTSPAVTKAHYLRGPSRVEPTE